MIIISMIDKGRESRESERSALPGTAVAFVTEASTEAQMPNEV